MKARLQNNVDAAWKAAHAAVGRKVRGKPPTSSFRDEAWERKSLIDRIRGRNGVWINGRYSVIKLHWVFWDYVVVSDDVNLYRTLVHEFLHAVVARNRLSMTHDEVRLGAQAAFEATSS